MFDFLNIKKLLGDVVSQRDALLKDIQAEQDEAKNLTTAPLQKADVIAYYDYLVDQLGGKYDAAFQFSLDRLHDDPVHIENTSGITVLTAACINAAATVHSVESALLSIFRDEIKASLRKRIEAMPWPKNVGPLIADRSALLEKSKKKLAGLEKDLAELRRQAAESGVSV
ncbi:MAG: hypothetical protein WC236_00090 [Gallionellaceae bacterium]|jgi:hypothetical protein